MKNAPLISANPARRGVRLRKLAAAAVAGCTMIALPVGLTLPTNVASASTNYRNYDGCSWKLSVDRSSWYIRTTLNIDVKEARSQDQNGGCHYMTAWLRKSDGSSLMSAGPTSNSYALVVDQNWGDRQGRGRATTWEHEWTQYMGWYND